MTRLHHKAEFIKKEEKEIFYKYFPDTIYQKGIFGEFKFDMTTWNPSITVKAEPKDEMVFYIDERCVEALTYKIKKHYEEQENFPDEIYFVA